MQYGNCDIRFPSSMKSAENIVAGCAERDNREVDNQFMVIEDLAHNAVGMIDTHNCDTKTGYFGESVALHEKMGFIKEGIIRRNVYTGGVYYDTIVYGMTRQEYLDLDREKQ